MGVWKEDRMTPQASAILGFLQRRGMVGATNVELSTIPDHYCQRFGARLDDLRKEGYRFSKRQEGKGRFRYWLLPSAREGGTQ